jgi:hypothetical protein
VILEDGSEDAGGRFHVEWSNHIRPPGQSGDRNSRSAVTLSTGRSARHPCGVAFPVPSQGREGVAYPDATTVPSHMKRGNRKASAISPGV